MGNNVAINNEMVSAIMGEILSETEELLAELEDGYTALEGSESRLWKP